MDTYDPTAPRSDETPATFTEQQVQIARDRIKALEAQLIRSNDILGLHWARTTPQLRTELHLNQ